VLDGIFVVEGAEGTPFVRVSYLQEVGWKSTYDIKYWLRLSALALSRALFVVVKVQYI
jgi:hypothetical protein